MKYNQPDKTTNSEEKNSDLRAKKLALISEYNSADKKHRLFKSLRGYALILLVVFLWFFSYEACLHNEKINVDYQFEYIPRSFFVGIINVLPLITGVGFLNNDALDMFYRFGNVPPYVINYGFYFLLLLCITMFVIEKLYVNKILRLKKELAIAERTIIGTNYKAQTLSKTPPALLEAARPSIFSGYSEQTNQEFANNIEDIYKELDDSKDSDKTP